MTIEEKAIDEIKLRLGIMEALPKQLYLLGLSLKYADISNWVETPKSKEEDILKQIFIIKACSFYHRKQLEYKEGFRNKCNDIKRVEFFEVANLRMQLPFYNIMNTIDRLHNELNF